MKRIFQSLFLVLFLAGQAFGAATFIDTPDATQSTGFWTSVIGTVVYDSTTTPKSGIASWKAGNAGIDQPNYSRKTLVSAGIGTYSRWVRFANLPTADAIFLQLTDPTGIENFSVQITTGGILRLVSGGVQLGSDGATLSTGTWYQVILVWNVTDTSTFDIRVFLDRTLTISVTSSGSLNSASFGAINEGWVDPPGANKFLNFQHVYLATGTSLVDPGDIRVTAKRPAANNTDNFDTVVGSCANHWDCVNERPTSTSNALEHYAASNVQENFTLEAASVGDVNIDGTVLSRVAWIRAHRDGGGTNTANANCTGSTSGTTCVTGSFTVNKNEVIVCGFGDRVGGSAPTISNSGTAHSWTALTGATSTVRCGAWYTQSAVAQSNTVTFTFGSSAAKRAGVCAVFDGITTSTPLDKNPAAASDGTSTYTSTTSGTLSQANEIVAGYFCTSRASSDTYGVGSGYTGDTGFVGTTGGSDVTAEIEHQVVAATTSLTATWTDSTGNGASVEGIATFKQKTPIGNGSPKIMDNGSESGVTLTTSSAFYSVGPTDSASYPSNAAGIGMRSSNSATATIADEMGTIVAYTAAAASVNFFPRRINRGGP